MTVMLVNDDGWDRPGIKTLEAALVAAGVETWVSAPSGNRSAQSHAMCLSGPVRMTCYGKNHYHCSGSPADCVLYALKGEVFPHLPDLVISGINHGYNCSSDILYSATCSAAAEAVLQGVKGIAVSHEADSYGNYDFEAVAAFVAANLDKLSSLAGPDVFVNLNFPPRFTGRVEACTLGQLWYGDLPQRSELSEDGSFTLRLGQGEVKRKLTSGEGRTDIEAVEEGSIALSVVRVNPAVDEVANTRARELFNQ